MFSTIMRKLGRWLCSGLAMTLAVQVQAGIVLNATRVIYDGAQKEVSLQVHNTGASEVLAQSWIDTGGEDTASSAPPFAVTPALARLPGDARQLIRIMYSGQGLPTDRESVLWLSVQEIPQAGRENELQIAIRQRIKLFYRPQGLTGDPLDAAQALEWRIRDGQLEVVNPTRYHVSMIKLEGRRSTKVVLEEDSRMLAPGERRQMPLQKPGGGPLELAFISINDFGAQERYHATVASDRPAQAIKTDPST
ncbi:molecular chaperone [Pseudomonas sp. GD03842]|uniref:fimbrial biogenesis chaperone n=1 Tax=unclassified Pseudomonas TaxID=196821 RepID=UPI0021153AA2|nr:MULTISPECIES: molecular chaperone [unclassified Pseudomonas]MDH0748402.1 molecular chaperone [Pseudomonas sp. GD03842]